MSTQYNEIKKQFDDMLNNGRIPCFEYELKDEEYLLVDVNVTKNGVEFSFDSDGKRVAFDGDIVKINDNRYYVKFDYTNDDLDDYLQLIDSNIIEGFLIVNDLMCE